MTYNELELHAWKLLARVERTRIEELEQGVSNLHVSLKEVTQRCTMLQTETHHACISAKELRAVIDAFLLAYARRASMKDSFTNEAELRSHLPALTTAEEAVVATIGPMHTGLQRLLQAQTDEEAAYGAKQ